MDTNIKDSNKLLHCSFCGKNQNEVNKLIAGPSVFICDECVDLCNEIISDELEEKSLNSRKNLPKPHEIKEILNEFVIGQDLTLEIQKIMLNLIKAMYFLLDQLALEKPFLQKHLRVF